MSDLTSRNGNKDPGDSEISGPMIKVLGFIMFAAIAAAVWWFTRDDPAPMPTPPAAATSLEAAKRSLAGPPMVLGDRTLGGEKLDAARSIKRLADGGFVLAARTRSSGKGKDEVLLLRLDPGLKPIWRKTFGTSGKDWVTSVAVMPDGGFALAGAAERGTATHVAAWVLRTDADGKVMWQQKVGGHQLDGATAIAALANGHVVVAGSVSSRGAGRYDAWLLSFDAKGEKVLDETYGGKQRDTAFALAVVKDGFALAGARASDTESGDQSDVWLLRIDRSGKMLWQKTWGGEGYQAAASLVALPDGGFVIAGHAGEAGDANGGGKPWVIRTDDKGEKIWDRKLDIAPAGASPRGWANRIIRLADGGFVVVGLAKGSDSADEQGWIARLRADGTVAWKLLLGGEKDDNILDVVALPDGGFLLAGFTNSKGAGDGDIWLVRLGYPAKK